MALGERATLVTELRLDDKLTPGLKKASGGLSKFDSIAGKAGRGLKTLGVNLARIGVTAGVAGAALAGVAVKSGIASLAELEDATTAVDGALQAVGKTAKLTSQQIAGWANGIEASVQAAFDDKAIVAGAASLLRYGKVAAKDLRPAMVVMTDLAAKTGDVSSAADLLAKAMAAPTKATRLLRQVGVTLTKAETDQLKVLEEAGRLEEAQAIILGKVATATRGAAAAAKGPYNDALNELADITEDTQKALAEGFLPVIKEVAGFLRTQLAKPEVMQGIRDIGKGLASGFQAAVNFAREIPWDAVMGAARGIAGFAKQALDFFNMMPDWAKQLLIGGFVANKLTGGAIGSIVKELGSGLIKGVLGMTAGVVNLKAGTVIGGPAAPGGGVTAVSKGGALFGLAKTIGAGLIAGIAVEKLFEQWGAFRTEGAAGAATLQRQTTAGVPQLGLADVRAALRNVQEQLGNPINDLALKLSGTFDQVKATEKALTDRIAYLEGGGTGTGKTGGRGDASTAAEVKRLGDKQALAARIVAAGGEATAARMDAIMDKNARTTASANEREARRLATLTDTTRSGLAGVVAAANATTAAIRNGFIIPPPSVTVTVNSATGFTTRTLSRTARVSRSINPAPIPGRSTSPVAT